MKWLIPPFLYYFFSLKHTNECIHKQKSCGQKKKGPFHTHGVGVYSLAQCHFKNNKLSIVSVWQRMAFPYAGTTWWFFSCLMHFFNLLSSIVYNMPCWRMDNKESMWFLIHRPISFNSPCYFYSSFSWSILCENLDATVMNNMNSQLCNSWPDIYVCVYSNMHTFFLCRLRSFIFNDDTYYPLTLQHRKLIEHVTDITY